MCKDTALRVAGGRIFARPPTPRAYQGPLITIFWSRLPPENVFELTAKTGIWLVPDSVVICAAALGMFSL